MSKFEFNPITGQLDLVGTGGGGTPAGADKDIQFNDAGSFGADTGVFTYGVDGTNTGLKLAAAKFISPTAQPSPVFQIKGKDELEDGRTYSSNIEIKGGDGTLLNGGNIELRSGDSFTSGVGGSINLTCGTTYDSNRIPADINLYTGQVAGTSSGGKVKIRASSPNALMAGLSTNLLTKDQDFEFPDKTGTFALTSDISPLNYNLDINSTGLISGGLLSINADPTKFDLSAGTGLVIDNYSVQGTPTITQVSWPGFTAQDPFYLATAGTTYVGINASANIVYKDEDFSPEERRTIIPIGWVDHPDNTTILFTRTEPAYNAEIQSQLNDQMFAMGPFTVDGNQYIPGTGLEIQKTEGHTFDNNANYEIELKNPHIILNPLETTCDILYFYRDGLGGWVNDEAAVTVINPNNWDDNSVTLATVPTDKWTIQIISLYPVPGYTGNDIQYGQHVYDTKEDAINAIYDPVTINPYNVPDLFRTFLVIKQGATDLSDTTQAEFINAGKFGLFANGDLNKSRVTALTNLTDVTITTPTTDEVLRFNGLQWVNSTPSPISAGAGVSYYFRDGASGISTYETISTTPDTASETDESIVVNDETKDFEAYSTTVALDRTVIDAGVWTFNIYTYATPSAGVSTLLFDVYQRDSGGTETLLFTAETPDIDNATVGVVVFSSVQPAYTIAATDLLVIKVRAKTTNTSNTTIHFVHSGLVNYSFVTTPLATKHNDLAGLQGGSSNQFYHMTQAQATVLANTSGTNSGDQVGDGVTITGTGTVGDPFVSAGGGMTTAQVMARVCYGV